MRLTSICLLVLCLSPSSFAARQEEAPATEQSCWGGEPRAELSNSLREILALPDDEIAGRLARARLTWRSTRNSGQALKTYAALRMRAAHADCETHKILLQISVARANLLRDLGRAQQAQTALLTPYPTSAELVAALNPTEVFPADIELIDAAAEMARIVSAEGASRPGEGADQSSRKLWENYGLENKVIDYLEREFGLPGHDVVAFTLEGLHSAAGHGRVLKLGVQLTPALVLLVLEDLDRVVIDVLPFDPFDLLMSVDSAAAAKIAFDWFEEGGDVWHRRLLHYIPRNIDLDQKWEWRHFDLEQEIRGGITKEEGWLDVFNLLLREETFGPQVLSIIHDTALWDGLTLDLQESLGEILRVSTPARAKQLLETLKFDFRVHSAVPVYEAGLENLDSDVRAECAARLESFWPSASFLTHASSEDARIGSSVMRSLLDVKTSVRFMQSNGLAGTRSGDKAGVFGPAELRVLEAGLLDEDSGVREVAVKVARDHDEIWRSLRDISKSSKAPELREVVARKVSSWFDRTDAEMNADLQALLQDPVASVRGGLLVDLVSNEGAEFEILTTLAADSTAWILSDVDYFLGEAAKLNSHDSFLAALRIRLDNEAAPFLPQSENSNGWQYLVERSSSGPTIPFAVLRLALERGIEPAVAAALDCLHDEGVRQHQDRLIYSPLLLDLPPDQRVILLEWTYANSTLYPDQCEFVEDAWTELVDEETCRIATATIEPTPVWVWTYCEKRLRNGQTPLGDLALKIYQDESRPWEERLRAGRFGDVLAGEYGYAQLLELLRSDSARFSYYVGSIARASSKSNEFLIEVANDERIDPAAKAIVIERAFNSSRRLAMEAAVIVVDTLMVVPEVEIQPTPGGPAYGLQSHVNPVRIALQLLGKHPEMAENRKRLIEAIRSPHYVIGVAAQMGQYQHPDFLEALGGSFSAFPSGRIAHYPTIDALLRYGSPEAATQLRRGLILVSADDRQRIESALETLDVYWARSADKSAVLGTRDEAAAELLSMLTSDLPLIRAEAAKGLAALGAPEAIPKLIPLLRDTEESVRKATLEALEMLRVRAEHAARAQAESAVESSDQ